MLALYMLFLTFQLEGPSPVNRSSLFLLICSTFPHIIHVSVRTHHLPRDILSQIKQNPFIISDTFCSRFIYSSTGIIICTHLHTQVQILLTWISPYFLTQAP